MLDGGYDNNGFKLEPFDFLGLELGYQFFGYLNISLLKKNQTIDRSVYQLNFNSGISADN